MARLDDSRTAANRRQAFAAESEANGRFLYHAQRAEAEGYPDIATLGAWAVTTSPQSVRNDASPADVDHVPGIAVAGYG